MTRWLRLVAVALMVIGAALAVQGQRQAEKSVKAVRVVGIASDIAAQNAPAPKTYVGCYVVEADYAYGMYIDIDPQFVTKWRGSAKHAKKVSDVAIIFGNQRVTMTFDEFFKRVGLEDK